jgi:hypothetical protein
VSASTESAFGSEALRRFGAVEDMNMTMPPCAKSPNTNPNNAPPHQVYIRRSVSEYPGGSKFKSQAIFVCGRIGCGDMLERRPQGDAVKTNTHETK